MEKFYIVTEESSMHRDYVRYRNGHRLSIGAVKEFMQDNDIGAKRFYLTNNQLYIVPTDSDVDKFGNILLSPVNDGLRAFRKNSKINKSWVEKLKNEKINIISKPMVGMYFEDCYGKQSARLFDIDDIVYCSFKIDGEINTPKGLTEIKASEFYKIVEDYNESLKANKESKDE